MTRGGSRAAATSKVELFVIIVNGFHYHKELDLGCCSSPRSASDIDKCPLNTPPKLTVLGKNGPGKKPLDLNLTIT